MRPQTGLSQHFTLVALHHLITHHPMLLFTAFDQPFLAFLIGQAIANRKYDP